MGLRSGVVLLQSGLGEGEPWLGAGQKMTMFALFEAGGQVVGLHHHPRLRRCAPHLGLTVWHLSEVLIGVTDLNVNCEL